MKAKPKGSAPSTVRAKIPLNRQIAQNLADGIQAGEIGPGQIFASEAEIARMYGVNRHTVRQAIHELVQQGLLTTSRGRRATVTSQILRYRINDAAESFTSAMARHGLNATHEVTHIANVGLADSPFPISKAQQLTRYSYRRLVEADPWSISMTWVAQDIAPSSWSGDRPILDEIADEHGLTIQRKIRTFIAVPANFEDTEELDVPLGGALLLVRGTSIDQNGRTVAAVSHRVRGDRAEYFVDFQSEQA